MAEIMISLSYNKDTGKKDIRIDYESDLDALPWEHESKHKELVKRVLGEGAFDPDDLGEIVVSRKPVPPKTQEGQTKRPGAIEQTS